MSERPELTPDMSASEFRRWYWTMAELLAFARGIGIVAGSKADLTDRIAAHLSGVPVHTAPSRPRPEPLVGPLTTATVIPPGQPSTEVLRRFFVGEIGPTFKFDGHMRAFLKGADGATLGDAIDQWHATRGADLPPQSRSLEFNQFTKQWHRANPGKTAAECRAAWAHYRSLPIDRRPAIPDA